MSAPLPPKEADLAAAKDRGQLSEATLNQVDESRGAVVHVSPDD